MFYYFTVAQIVIRITSDVGEDQSCAGSFNGIINVESQFGVAFSFLA